VHSTPSTRPARSASARAARERRSVVAKRARSPTPGEGRSKDRVAIAALAAAALLGGWLVLRSGGGLGTSWSDGARRYESESANGVRHAVWDAPEELPGLVGEAADPTLSPDGRWLVFAVGERGLNAELYLAERVNGALGEPEPLAAVNSSADDIAPAFGEDGLYFASDRPGGMGELDLWRAPYDDGLFGPPERLGSGLNSSYDDTDPAPCAGSPALYFASRRALGSGYDLYRAEPDADGFYATMLLEGLNTAANEREPALTHDQRSLYFASDREGGAGHYDLYRSVHAEDRWSAPAPVPGLNSATSERGPWVASDGFALYFDVQEEHGERALRLARSLELFLVPPPAVALSEWILLGGLIALASLAMLAKRWYVLDLHYKCLLASLVVHALVMLYLNTVSPRSVYFPDGAGTGASEATFTLTMQSRPGSSSREGSGGGGDGGPGSGGVPALARASFDGGLLGGPATPGVAVLDEPARGEEAGPVRLGELARPASAGSAALPELVEREAPLERLSAAAPALALAAPTSSGRGTLATGSAAASSTPSRAAGPGDTGLGRAQPGALALQGEAAADPGTGGPAPSALERDSCGEPAVAVAAPRESFEPAGGSSPDFVVEAPAGAGRARANGAGVERLGFAPAASSGAGSGSAHPERAVELAPATAVGVAAGAGARGGPPRVGLEWNDVKSGPGPQSADPGAALRAPEHEGGPVPGGSSAGFDAVAGFSGGESSGAGGARGGSGTAAPTRVDGGAGVQGFAAAGAAPTPQGANGLLAALGSPGAGGTASAPARKSLELTGSAASQGSGTNGTGLAVRAPSRESSGPGTAERPAFDAMSGLAAGKGTGATGPSGGAPDGTDRGTGPSRSGAGPPGTGTPDAGSAAPARGAGEGLVAGAGSGSADSGAGPARAPLDLGGAGDGAGPGNGTGREGEGLALRAPSKEGTDGGQGGRARNDATSFDATAGLSAPARDYASSAASAAPERARLGARTDEPARPEARPLPSSLPPPVPSAALGGARPPRLAETPYQNRFGAQKLRALEDFGGTPETEHAVAAGLAYLARIQGENGEWGQRADRHSKYLDVRIGKSALALLAFLGAGHVPGGASEHAGVAQRTLEYLLGEQDAASGHFGRSCSYGHGIATYALAECYALTQDAALRAPLERAVEEILRHQSKVDDPRFLGGWGYYFADGHVWNGDEWPRTSVTAWQVMALESARLGGLEVPDQAFEDAREFLVNTWDEEQRAFRYDHDPERLGSGYPILPASTPAALFALSLVSVDLSARELAPARRFVLTRAPDGYRYTGDDDFVQHARGNLYFWYYATLAMFRVGGPEWEHWNAALQATLLPAQEEDGSWRPIDTYSQYAGDDDAERTYSTAMCVLSLEIYYRYFTPLLRVKK